MYNFQSRYYDPEVGRFLNADDTNYLGASGTTLGYNLYAYCENNAVNYVDYYGYWSTESTLGVIDIVITIGSLFVPGVGTISTILKSALTVYYIGRIVSASIALRKAKNYYQRFSNVVSIVVNVLSIIGTWLCVSLSNATASVGRAVYSALHKVWGTALFGSISFIQVVEAM